MKRDVTIGLIQMHSTASKEDNLKRALEKIDEAAKKGADIVALPELFLSQYFCQKKDDKKAFEETEPIPGPTIAALSEAAKKNGIVLVGGSIFEKADGKFYNTAPIFGPDGTLLTAYRKTHIPEDNLYHEQHYFEPGDTGIKVVDTKFGKICVLICFDQWFPEAARIATLQGAELIFYPTAIGVIDADVEENITGDWEQMWRNAQLGHAASNNVFVAAINRVGKEGSINFWGGSFIAGPASEVLAITDDKEDILLQTVDLARVKPLQDAWGFLRNRRPETYKPLTDV